MLCRDNMTSNMTSKNVSTNCSVIAFTSTRIYSLASQHKHHNSNSRFQLAGHKTDLYPHLSPLPNSYSVKASDMHWVLGATRVCGPLLALGKAPQGVGGARVLSNSFLNLTLHAPLLSCVEWMLQLASYHVVFPPTVRVNAIPL